MNLEGIFGWFSNLTGSISFFVVPVVQGNTWLDVGAIVSGLFSTLVGGVLAIFVAYKSFKWATDAEAERREKDRLDLAATNAYSGYAKLAQSMNLLANLEDWISKAYDEARAAGRSIENACEVVPVFVGRFNEPAFLAPAEYSFLHTKQNQDLIDQILLLEQRASNTVSLINEYKRLSVEFDSWREAVCSERSTDGVRVFDVLSNDLRGAEATRRANLNHIIDTVVGNIEQELKDGDKTVQLFIDAAHQEYGDRFPPMKFGASTE